ncbi:MAG TPA: alpha-hydroxy acid oxidase [Gaiellales bacterium]|nr:alpha-hydroxy acid oxidase [Gaiellales bacterium]
MTVPVPQVDPSEITLANVEELARSRLDAGMRAYFGGGAAGERTLRRNLGAYREFVLRPRVLAGLESTSTVARVAGHDLGMPVLAAPMASLRLAHPDGDEGIAGAAAATGAGVVLPTLSLSTPQQVAAAAPDAVRWYQVYVLRDRGLTDELIGEALAAGYTAIVLTVDLPVIGTRDRELAASWAVPEPDVPALRRAIERGAPERGPGQPGFPLVDPTVDWPYVERLCSRFGVPVLVKGVLRADDALLAAEHGAAGIVVSNHGGRQLDGVAATISALPEISEAVADRLDVLVDSGVRRGSDVVTALALGARAVMVGRPVMWGLVAAGEAGARRVLELFREEIEVALHLLGCARPADVSRDRVGRRT